MYSSRRPSEYVCLQSILFVLSCGHSSSSSCRASSFIHQCFRIAQIKRIPALRFRAFSGRIRHAVLLFVLIEELQICGAAVVPVYLLYTSAANAYKTSFLLRPDSERSDHGYYRVVDQAAVNYLPAQSLDIRVTYGSFRRATNLFQGLNMFLSFLL